MICNKSEDFTYTHNIGATSDLDYVDFLENANIVAPIIGLESETCSNQVAFKFATPLNIPKSKSNWYNKRGWLKCYNVLLLLCDYFTVSFESAIPSPSSWRELLGIQA